MSDMHREAFERMFSAPPFEFHMDRWPNDPSVSWPGVYKDYRTNVALEGWQAALRYRDEQEKQA